MDWTPLPPPFPLPFLFFATIALPKKHAQSYNWGKYKKKHRHFKWLAQLKLRIYTCTYKHIYTQLIIYSYIIN